MTDLFRAVMTFNLVASLVGLPCHFTYWLYLILLVLHLLFYIVHKHIDEARVVKFSPDSASQREQ